MPSLYISKKSSPAVFVSYHGKITIAPPAKRDHLESQESRAHAPCAEHGNPHAHTAQYPMAEVVTAGDDERDSKSSSAPLPTGLSNIVAAVSMIAKTSTGQDSVTNTTHNTNTSTEEASIPMPLSCRDYYESKGRDPKILFAFLTGVTSPHEYFGLQFPFSLCKPPFRHNRRVYKPTSNILQQEIIRRARIMTGTTLVLRPYRWSTEVLHETLTVTYSPIFTNDDKSFLRATCIQVYQQESSERETRREAGKRSVLESKQQSKTARSMTHRQIHHRDLHHHHCGNGGYREFNTTALLRLYHTLAHLRNYFLQARVKKASIFTCSTFWLAVATQFNDKTWVPMSIPIVQLHGFQRSIALPFNLGETPAQSTELAAIFDSIQSKLIKVVGEWNKLFHPPITVIHPFVPGVVEQYDYAGYPNRLESQSGVVEEHVMYLWEFANENEFLGTCMRAGIVSQQSTNADAMHEMKNGPKGLSGQSTPVAKGAVVQEQNRQVAHTPAEGSENELSPEELATIVVPVTSQNQGHVSVTSDCAVRDEGQIEEKEINDPNIDDTVVDKILRTNAIGNGSMSKPEVLTAAHEVTLQYLRLQNTIENELLELEIKALSEYHSETERTQYRRFAAIKRTSLQAVKHHLGSCAAHAMQLSKSFGLPDTAHTALHLDTTPTILSEANVGADFSVGVSATNLQQQSNDCSMEDGTQIESNQDQSKGTDSLTSAKTQLVVTGNRKMEGIDDNKPPRKRSRRTTARLSTGRLYPPRPMSGNDNTKNKGNNNNSEKMPSVMPKKSRVVTQKRTAAELSREPATNVRRGKRSKKMHVH